MVIIIGGLCLPTISYAQIVITQTQDLDFGTFAIADFNALARLTIRNDGNPNPNANLTVLVNPTRGEFTLTGGPANTVYTVTTPADFLLTGPGGNFIIDNIRIRPNTLRTNGAGADDFRIMARLRSLGGGVVYGNGDYDNTFDITVAF